MRRREGYRSDCPINRSLEILGDRWTLIVLRDVIFGGKRHFRELLTCEEGIASNLLADRLKTLLTEGMLTRTDDPTHRQRAVYSLTEKSIALVPVLAQLAAWGRYWLGVSAVMGARARALEEGGPALWERFMVELRAEHLGARHPDAAPGAGSVKSILQAAADRALANSRPADSRRGMSAARRGKKVPRRRKAP